LIAINVYIKERKILNKKLNDEPQGPKKNQEKFKPKISKGKK
jgi:hypothetical protein